MLYVLAKLTLALALWTAPGLPVAAWFYRTLSPAATDRQLLWAMTFCSAVLWSLAIPFLLTHRAMQKEAKRCETTLATSAISTASP